MTRVYIIYIFLFSNMNLFRNYKRPFDRSTLRQEISLITIFFQGRNGDPQSFQRLQLRNYVLFPPLTIKYSTIIRSRSHFERHYKVRILFFRRLFNRIILSQTLFIFDFFQNVSSHNGFLTSLRNNLATEWYK